MNKDAATPRNEVIPSVENREELARLSKKFKPDDVKFLLPLNMDSSKEESMAAAKGMTERLVRFIENGYNHEKAGLDPVKYEHHVFG